MFGDLDFAADGDGRWDISWHFVPCEGSSDQTFLFEGSNEFYWKVMCSRKQQSRENGGCVRLMFSSFGKPVSLHAAWSNGFDECSHRCYWLSKANAWVNRNMLGQWISYIVTPLVLKFFPAKALKNFCPIG